MSKTFREWNVNQSWLLPPSIHDFVPPGHIAHFVRNTVAEQLDLWAILKDYESPRGFPPYHPVMMTAVLLYAYCQGVYSSRRIAKGCEQRLDFMAVSGMQRPDFRTISDFRKRHLRALGQLFSQVLLLCQKAGLVKLGHVAIDGTKIQANASKHKAMSYARMKKVEPELAAQVKSWFEKAEQLDAKEDQEYGKEKRGDEMPEWVANKQKRLEKMRQAMAELEQEAAAAAAELPPPPLEAEKKPPGRKRKQASGEVPPKAQRNFTDPQSRIMKTANGYVQGYNSQAAVDSKSQVIVAQATTQQENDKQQLVAMVDRIKTNTGKAAREVSADAGYCSEENLQALEDRKICGYVATGRQKHGQSCASGEKSFPLASALEAMRRKLKRAGWRSRYRLRKQIVEPVFGQIKQARGFRQFLLRGFQKVQHEWSMVCLAHNLLKLAAAR